jgi:peptide deformylase
MKIKIACVGEPVLRDAARPLLLDEIGTDHIRHLIEHMRETLADAPGVGLAAPQIGQSLQLAIIEDKAEYQTTLTPDELKQRERSAVSFHVLINPEIELLATPDLSFFEGCLSLPGYVAMVPRARAVRVRALDEAGCAVEIEAKGWYARILQHEIDHLKGTLYIDRMWSRSFCSVDHYNRYWKSRPVNDLLQEFCSASDLRCSDIQ